MIHARSSSAQNHFLSLWCPKQNFPDWTFLLRNYILHFVALVSSVYLIKFHVSYYSEQWWPRRSVRIFLTHRYFMISLQYWLYCQCCILITHWYWPKRSRLYCPLWIKKMQNQNVIKIFCKLNFKRYINLI